jgi:hypothetical protein
VSIDNHELLNPMSRRRHADVINQAPKSVRADAQRSSEVVMVVRDAVRNERQDQRPWIRTPLCGLSSQVIRVPGIHIQRQMETVLLDRPYREEGRVGLLKSSLSLGPGELAK